MIEGHGDDAYKYATPIRYNFSSNVYCHIDNTPLKSYLREHLHVMDSYPEPEPFELECMIAAQVGVLPSSIMVTNGATEAIYLIASAYRAQRSAVLIPTFSEYADACRVNAHHVDLIGSTDDISGVYDVVWICNPNNPTGGVIAHDELLDIIQSHPETLFVIDQSYEFFTSCHVLSAAEAVHAGNLLQLHSMTKRYAIPGLRLGFVVGVDVLISRLRAIRMPWSVNSIAIEAGKFIYTHPDESAWDIHAYLQERERLRRCLNQLSDEIHVLPTETHFMLVKLHNRKAADLKNALACQGILIRDASNFAGLDDRYFRIAAQTPDEDDILIQAIKEWL